MRNNGHQVKWPVDVKGINSKAAQKPMKEYIPFAPPEDKAQGKIEGIYMTDM